MLPNPVRVLIVEDDQISRRALGRLLQSVGYRVLFADSAERAMQILENEDWPDVILLDVDLPGMPGDEFMVHLKRMVPDAVVILVTAQERASIRADAGTDINFLRKPVNATHLLNVLGESTGHGPCV